MMSKKRPKNIKGRVPIKKAAKGSKWFVPRKRQGKQYTTKAVTRNGPGTTGFLTDTI